MLRKNNFVSDGDNFSKELEMRRLSVLAVFCGLAALASPALADYPTVPPVPGYTVGPPPTPDGGAGAPAAGAPVQLYHCVKYEDLHNIHPCAVPKIVAVPDPCPQPCGCCRPCAPRCVYVKICVPPCGCVKIKRSKCGRKIKYDYGKYEVEIESRKGYVKVDYDD